MSAATAPNHELTLYTYFRSSASARVRTVMELHGVRRTDKYVHLLKADQKSAAYTALNPAQTLPLLEIKEADGSVWHISQCIAIMEWLDEAYGPSSPTGHLLPRNPRDRAGVRSIVDLVVGDLFPMLTMGTLNKVKERGVDAGEWAQTCSKQYLTALEAIVKKTSAAGRYAYGDGVTLADVAIATQMGTVSRFCPDLVATFPTLSKIFAHISQLPQFLAADWQHQPDTPAELRA